ncbi:YjfB family protein [Deferrisoma camini]|uniref:YjfB family protein n=1 Tax=Deferrisoma camini TaxID=1035120 RepID=UPI00046CC589|nr:YjfB family protein [Deferrisoma camini]
MDLRALGNGDLTMGLIEEMTGLKADQAKGEAGMALLKKVLDNQEALAAELFRSLGVGGNLDVKA